MLSAVRVGMDCVIDKPTIARFDRRKNECSGGILRTLDFATAGYGPVQYAGWQCATSVYNPAGRRATDHKAVEIRFRRRARPNRRKKDVRNDPIPAWLFRKQCHCVTIHQ